MPDFPLQVETRRLYIRPSDPAAAASVNAAIGESINELQQWMPWADHLPSLEETLTHLQEAQGHFRAGTDCGLTLWEKATGIFVGGSGLHPRSPDPTRREIGYWIRSSMTGQGYATEAVKAIADTGFATLGLTAIEIRASVRNTGSRRVAERAGFAPEVVLDDGRLDPGGHASQTVVYVRYPNAA